MKAQWCVPLLVAGTTACTAPSTGIDLPPEWPAASRPLTVEVVEGGAASIRRVRLEQYVQGTILSEYAAAGGDSAAVARMYEVQAVISRTYAVTNGARHTRDGFDLCAATHCQVYDPSRLRTSRWRRAAAEAVSRTEGLVLWHDAAPARALFHADCGGHTSSAGSVWGGRDLPYLIAAPDDGPAGAAHTTWRYEAAHAAVLRALNADPRTPVGTRLDTIEVLDRDQAGRAEWVALHGRREIIVRGEDLRDVLTRSFGPRSIRSTRFTVRRTGAVFTFEGRGFGHGVGLCQAGALARLRAGESAAAVLHRYFPGTRIAALK